MSNFNYAVDLVLKNEGGYVNNPKDPGRETKYGISKRTYPNADIKNLTIDAAKQIYFMDYWKRNRLDAIEDKEIAAAALDTVVNHGAGPSLIQKALRETGALVAVDGAIGPATIAALNGAVPKSYLGALYSVRKAYYEDLVRREPSKAEFMRGWMKRISRWKGGFAAGGFILLTVGAMAFFFIRRKRIT